MGVKEDLVRRRIERENAAAVAAAQAQERLAQEEAAAHQSEYEASQVARARIIEAIEVEVQRIAASLTDNDWESRGRLETFTVLQQDRRGKLVSIKKTLAVISIVSFKHGAHRLLVSHLNMRSDGCVVFSQGVRYVDGPFEKQLGAHLSITNLRRLLHQLKKRRTVTQQSPYLV